MPSSRASARRVCLCRSLGAASALILTLAPLARGAGLTTTARVRVSPGALALAAAPAARAGPRGYYIPLQLVDARGSGAGWRVAIAATPGSVVTTTAVRSTCSRGSSCVLPVSAVRYPVAAFEASPATVLSASPHSGLGGIDLKFRVSLATAKRARRARVSFSVVSGP